MEEQVMCQVKRKEHYPLYSIRGKYLCKNFESMVSWVFIHESCFSNAGWSSLLLQDSFINKGLQDK